MARLFACRRAGRHYRPTRQGLTARCPLTPAWAFGLCTPVISPWGHHADWRGKCPTHPPKWGLGGQAPPAAKNPPAGPGETLYISGQLRNKHTKSRRIRGNLKDTACKWLKTALLNGKIWPDQMISMQDLMNIAETPIAPTREAVQMLEFDGLMRIFPKRGAQIAGLNLDFIRSIS